METDKPRILIVEDHIETRIMLYMALTDTFEVVAYDGATTALEHATDEHHDVCLLDISLRDEIDGVELMERLRALPNFKDTPMIAMTALTWDNSGRQLLEKGFDRFVQKPFDPTILVHLLQTLSRDGRSDVHTVPQAIPSTAHPHESRDER